MHPNQPLRRELVAANRGRVEAFEPGSEIIRIGDPVNEHSKFYLIRRGMVDVWRPTEEDGPPRMLAELGPGQYFGEVALLMDRPRNATVRAKDRVEVYTADRGRSTATRV